MGYMSVLCIWDGAGWKGSKEGFDLETEDLGGGGWRGEGCVCEQLTRQTG
jgi:hypothetical protein